MNDVITPLTRAPALTCPLVADLHAGDLGGLDVPQGGAPGLDCHAQDQVLPRGDRDEH